MLSGGMDARALAAAAESDFTAYTAAGPINREVRTARAIARAKGWPHVLLQRSDDHYLRIMDEAIELCGGMSRYDHCHFLGLLDAVRQRSDVVFVEEQVDVLFKGYYWARCLYWKGLQVGLPLGRSFAAAGIEDQMLQLDYKTLFPSKPWLLFREPWRSQYLDIMRASVREQLADAGPDSPDHMVEHIGGYVSPGRTGAFQNIACVRPYVEYRSFCFDSELLDLALRMPRSCKSGGRTLKQVLKRLDPDLFAIRYANTGLRLDTPPLAAWAVGMAGEAARLTAAKLGLRPGVETNESWPDRGELLRLPAMRSILEATLRDPQCLPPEVFDAERVDQMLAEHASRRRHHTRMLLCLLTFGRWFREHGPSDVE